MKKKKQIRKALQLATVDSVFTFTDNLYTQTDGVVMGSPVSLTYANALLSTKIMVKSMLMKSDRLYRRYMDGTFLILKICSQIENSFLSEN